MERKEMPISTHFVVFKADSRYSITESSPNGVRQAFITDGALSGDEGVLRRLSRIKPSEVSMEHYIERNAGHLIFDISSEGSRGAENTRPSFLE
jgi:hypothetical protein